MNDQDPTTPHDHAETRGEEAPPPSGDQPAPPPSQEPAVGPGAVREMTPQEIAESQRTRIAHLEGQVGVQKEAIDQVTEELRITTGALNSQTKDMNERTARLEAIAKERDALAEELKQSNQARKDLETKAQEARDALVLVLAVESEIIRITGAPGDRSDDPAIKDRASVQGVQALRNQLSLTESAVFGTYPTDKAEMEKQSLAIKALAATHEIVKGKGNPYLFHAGIMDLTLPLLAVNAQKREVAYRMGLVEVNDVLSGTWGPDGDFNRDLDPGNVVNLAHEVADKAKSFENLVGVSTGEGSSFTVEELVKAARALKGEPNVVGIDEQGKELTQPDVEARTSGMTPDGARVFIDEVKNRLANREGFKAVNAPGFNLGSNPAVPASVFPSGVKVQPLPSQPKHAGGLTTAPPRGPVLASPASFEGALDRLAIGDQLTATESKDLALAVRRTAAALVALNNQALKLQHLYNSAVQDNLAADTSLSEGLRFVVPSLHKEGDVLARVDIDSAKAARQRLAQAVQDRGTFAAVAGTVLSIAPAFFA